MKKTLKLMASMLATATFALVIASCVDEAGNTADIDSIMLVPNKQTVGLGSKSILTANLSPVNAARGGLTWNSSNTEVATVASLGELTSEVTTLALGTTTVTVTASNGKTATCEITVIPAVLTIGVKIEGDRLLLIGQGLTYQLIAVPVPHNATDFVPEWSSSNDTVATVSETGLISALTLGTATITLRSEEFSTSVEITVIPYVPATSLEIMPSSRSISVGDTLQFSATPLPADITEEFSAPVWTSSNETIATVDPATGLFTAIAPGTVTITATSDDVSKSFEMLVIHPDNIMQIVTGLWQFSDPYDPTKADVGQPLQPVGEGFIPNPDGYLSILRGSYGKALHGITANGGGNRVNEYALLFDFRISETGRTYTFFQSNLSNDSDASVYINSDGNIGVGATGHYGPVKTGLWHRLVIARDRTLYYYYLDGIKMNNNIINVTIDDSRSLSPEGVLLFADNDGEDNDIDISTIAIWNRPLSEQEVSVLGTAE